jgi:hypothetical protein
MLIVFIVFGLNRLGLEPTIYRTRGKHANHYATDAVFQGRRLNIKESGPHHHLIENQLLPTMI